MDENNGRFIRFLEHKYHNKFLAKANTYVEQNEKVIIEKCKNIQYAADISIDELEYKLAWSQVAKKGIVCYVAINMILIVTDGGSRGYDDETIYHWILVPCSFSFENQFNKIAIKDAITYDNSYKPTKLLLDDNNLIPKIYGVNQYEKVAEEILKIYYPEAFTSTSKIDTDLLAKRMGLNIIERKIDGDGLTFGQIYYYDKDVSLYDYETDEWKEETIGKDTIVCDKNSAYLHSFGSPRMTVAHECVHYFLHKPAIYLAKHFKKSISGLQCLVNGQKKDEEAILPFDVLEIQANTLAPYILMPEKSFKSMAHRIIKETNTTYGGNLLNHSMEVIYQLADHYQVTANAVRRRLIDIGYTVFQGALNWVDNAYAPPYSFDKDSLKKNQTFTISTKDYFKLLDDNKSLMCLPLLTGSLIFVENHVVINNEKYVKKSNNGNLQLTHEARMHLNKCAIKFDIKTINAVDEDDRIGTMCYLCMNTNFQYDIKAYDENNKEVIDLSLSNLRLIQEKERELDAIKFMSTTEALKKLMEFYNVSDKVLCVDSGIERRNLQRIKNGEIKKPNLDIMIQLCIGLKLKPNIANMFLTTNGDSLKPGDSLHNDYELILGGAGSYSIKAINKMLKDDGQPEFKVYTYKD